MRTSARVFLDNTVNMCTDELRALYTCRSCGNCGEELAEVTSAFEEALETIRAAAANEPFQCAHIESTLAERDIGRDSLEREAAAFDEGREALERLTSGWEELSIDEPSSLEARLEAELQASREALHPSSRQDASLTIEHVMASVLETFDARSKEEAQGVIFKNRTAAASSTARYAWHSYGSTRRASTSRWRQVVRPHRASASTRSTPNSRSWSFDSPARARAARSHGNRSSCCKISCAWSRWMRERRSSLMTSRRAFCSLASHLPSRMRRSSWDCLVPGRCQPGSLLLAVRWNRAPAAHGLQQDEDPATPVWWV